MANVRLRPEFDETNPRLINLLVTVNFLCDGILPTSFNWLLGQAYLSLVGLKVIVVNGVPHLSGILRFMSSS
jgi:hypothetical protein